MVDGFCYADIAEVTVAHEFYSGLVSCGASTLCAVLDNFPVGFGGFFEVVAFGDGVGAWLFYVDVFTGFEGRGCDGGVPMVGGSDAYGVDFFVAEDFAVVAVFCDVFWGATDTGWIDVCDGDDFAVGLCCEFLYVCAGSAAHADDSVSDCFVG